MAKFIVITRRILLSIRYISSKWLFATCLFLLLGFLLPFMGNILTSKTPCLNCRYNFLIEKLTVFSLRTIIRSRFHLAATFSLMYSFCSSGNITLSLPQRFLLCLYHWSYSSTEPPSLKKFIRLFCLSWAIYQFSSLCNCNTLFIIRLYYY